MIIIKQKINFNINLEIFIHSLFCDRIFSINDNFARKSDIE